MSHSTAGTAGAGDTAGGLSASIVVRRRYFDVQAAFDVPAGGRFALFGPSGSGKTTMLEAIAGTVPIESGRISLAGRVLSERGGSELPLAERRVGLLRQSPGLFPHMSVAANIGYSLRSRGADTCAKVAELASRLGIEGLLGARPAALSGGQRQRVAIARLLASSFEVLLLDEPFTGLDAALRRELAGVLEEAAALRGAPALLVTHDLAEAQSFAERIGVIDAGRLLQVGESRELVRRPASTRVASLLGYVAFLPADALACRPPGATPEGTLRGRSVGIHPDALYMAAGPPATRAPHAEPSTIVEGVVTGVRPRGPALHVEVLLGARAPRSSSRDGVVVATPVPPGLAVPEPGSTVALELRDPPSFDSSGHAAG